MKTILTTGALLVSLATTASASVLVNGSFEQDPGTPGINGENFGDLPGAVNGETIDFWTQLPGWKSESGFGIEVQTADTLPFIDPQDGDYYVELDSVGNSSMYQEVFLAAGAWELSFFYSPREPEAATNIIDFSIANPGDTVLDGNVFGPQPDILGGEWTEFATQFVVQTAGNYFLNFEAAGISDNRGGLLDNISVSPVPVPAAGLLLLTALGGAAALRRRS